MTVTSLKAKPNKLTEAQQLAEWLARGKTEVFTVTADVTPDLARLLLAHNDGNRHIQWKGGGGTRSVSAYAAAMKRGEWQLNGAGIVVSKCGQMNDGQHRLHAVIEAMIPVPMHLTFGIERDSRHTVDQGIARSPGAILSMYGHTHANQLATAAQMVWAHDNGVSFNYRPSPDQLLETVERHPDLQSALSECGSLVARYKLASGPVTLAHYLCRRHNPMIARQYLEALTSGLNITNVNDPVARLRRAFEDHKAQLKGLRIDRITQGALYIKGFNYSLRGRTGPIAWRAVGPTAEAFPTPGA